MKSIFPLPAHNKDNGLQYNCREFRQFKEEYGIEHITSSSLYSQSNGFAERMVQTVKNTLRWKRGGPIPWFSNDVTKFQTLELLILLRIYFHDE